MTAEIAAVVATRLAGERVRAMFGGWAIYRDGQMVAIVYDGRTYVKAVSEAAQARFVAAGLGPFRPRPKQTLKSFWEVPPAVMHDGDDLAAWVATSQ